MEDDPQEHPAGGGCSTCLSRRALLRGGAAGALLVVLPVACMQENVAPMGPVAAGNVADIPVDTLQMVSGQNLILGRDAGGLFAMTRVCTHQGQLVTIISAAGTPALHCYGHGSEFNMNGAVTRGPAGSPLEHFKVDVDVTTGSITVQGAMIVAATDRTPVG
jgi:Rieske Fe-S protein